MHQQIIVWTALCATAVVVALLCPRAARYVFGGFFILMALGVNVLVAILAPASFVGLGTNGALLRPYQWVFENLVAAAPVPFGLTIAAYEVLVGTLMMAGGRRARWGLLGGIAFLVVSSPLSTWTLPNLVFAAALAIVLLRSRTFAEADQGVRVPRADPTHGSRMVAAIPSAGGEA